MRGCVERANRDCQNEFSIPASMIIYRIAQLQITVSSLKLSFSRLMENRTCSPLGFSVQTLVFISECSELIIIMAEKPVLVSCVQKCLLCLNCNNSNWL